MYQLRLGTATLSKKPPNNTGIKKNGFISLSCRRILTWGKSFEDWSGSSMMSFRTRLLLSILRELLTVQHPHPFSGQLTSATYSHSSSRMDERARGALPSSWIDFQGPSVTLLFITHWSDLLTCTWAKIKVLLLNGGGKQILGRQIVTTTTSNKTESITRLVSLRFPWSYSSQIFGIIALL